MPLVQPLPADHDREVAALFGLLEHRNDAMPTELAAPAAADGRRWLAAQGWSAGKHGAQDTAPGGAR